MKPLFVAAERTRVDDADPAKIASVFTMLASRAENRRRGLVLELGRPMMSEVEFSFDGDTITCEAEFLPEESVLFVGDDGVAASTSAEINAKWQADRAALRPLREWLAEEVKRRKDVRERDDAGNLKPVEAREP